MWFNYSEFLFYSRVGHLGFTYFASLFMWFKRDTFVELSKIVKKLLTWVDAVTFRILHSTNVEIDRTILQTLMTQAMLRECSFYQLYSS